MQMFYKIILKLTGFLFVLTTAAYAHHGIAAYDPNLSITITGTVTQFEWQNPHVEITIETENKRSPEAGTWIAEGFSPGILKRLGWTPNAMKVGDKVTAMLAPRRDKTKAGLLTQITVLQTNKTLYAYFHNIQEGPDATASLEMSLETKPIMNPAPTAEDWAKLATLPDFSGVWFPEIKSALSPLPAFTSEAKAQILAEPAAVQAGKLSPLFANCLPFGMPSWVLVGSNAFEILSTPGRLTFLGELDGEMRRIYTDGRPHPKDLTPTLHGDSIGHWEGNVLVVDTVGISPQAYIALDKTTGIPNNGNMHITERIYISSYGSLTDDIEINAPKVLSKPWKIRKLFYRQRARAYDLVEGSCIEGNFISGKDQHGNDIYVPIQLDKTGNPLFPKQ